MTRAISAPDILRIWENGLRLPPVDRALTLLGAACPEMSGEELASMSIGRRDSHLLELRERSFGAEVNAFAECPQCAERLELAFQAAEIRGGRSDESQLLDHQCDGIALRFRMPNSADLNEAMTAGSVEAARKVVLCCCVVEARHNGTPIATEHLPNAALEQIAHRLDDAQSAAEVLVAMECPACSHRWQALFDIAAFLWSEVAAQARRLLREVDALARAYGWRESDILAMNFQRRQAYLELIANE